MADIEDLYSLYQSFCQFGSTKALNASVSTLSGPLMDGSKFAKFARDCKLIEKSITSTEIDIVFNKVKKRDARKMDFDSFQAALKLIAAKRSPSLDGHAAYIQLVKFVCAKRGPKATGTVPKASYVVDRLTDTSKYTGTHKHRFDQNGNGMGIVGRDRPNPTANLSQITNRQPATITGVPMAAALQAGWAGSNRSLNSVSATTPKTALKLGAGSTIAKKRDYDLVKSKDSLSIKKK